MCPKARVLAEQKSLPRRVRDYESRCEGGIRAPAEEGSEWDGTILKLVLSF